MSCSVPGKFWGSLKVFHGGSPCSIHVLHFLVGRGFPTPGPHTPASSQLLKSFPLGLRTPNCPKAGVGLGRCRGDVFHLAYTRTWIQSPIWNKHGCRGKARIKAFLLLCHALPDPFTITSHPHALSPSVKIPLLS